MRDQQRPPSTWKGTPAKLRERPPRITSDVNVRLHSAMWERYLSSREEKAPSASADSSPMTAVGEPDHESWIQQLLAGTDGELEEGDDIVYEEEDGAPSSGQSIWLLPTASEESDLGALNEACLALAREIERNQKQKELAVVPTATLLSPPVNDNHGASYALPMEKALEDAVSSGARVVVLRCSRDAATLQDGALRRFWQLAEALRLPVILRSEAFSSAGTALPFLQEIDALCSVYPEATIILPHLAQPISYEALKLSRKHKGFCLDISPNDTTHPLLEEITPSKSTADVSTKESDSPEGPSADAEEEEDEEEEMPSPTYQLLVLACQSRLLFGSSFSPTSSQPSRADLAQRVRDLVRKWTVEVMGGFRVEDIGGEMERTSKDAERKILGEAARDLIKGIKTVEEARMALGWDEEAVMSEERDDQN